MRARDLSTRDRAWTAERPWVLPPATPELAPVPLRARERPEDFRVTEVLREDSGGTGGDGTHLWFEIEKRGIATPVAVRRLAQALGRNPGEFGRAGLKDARAVARQTLSLEHLREAELEAVEVPDVCVLGHRRRDRKLKPGQLLGNRFELVLRGVDAGGAERAARVLAVLAERGMPNAYGPQRFGRDGRAHELGALLLARRPDAYAARLLEAETDGGRQRPPLELRAFAERLARRPDRPAEALRRVPADLRRLHVAALQAALFNRVLAARMEAWDGLEPGDLAFVHASGACFAVDDPAELEERRAALAISASGPVAGSAVLRPGGRPGELESAAWSALGLEPGDFRRAGRGLDQKGARRPLRVPVTGLEVERRESALALAFFLPKGAYASVLIEEIRKHGSPDPAPDGAAPDDPPPITR